MSRTCQSFCAQLDSSIRLIIVAVEWSVDRLVDWFVDFFDGSISSVFDLFSCLIDEPVERNLHTAVKPGTKHYTLVDWFVDFFLMGPFLVFLRQFPCFIDEPVQRNLHKDVKLGAENSLISSQSARRAFPSFHSISSTAALHYINSHPISCSGGENNALSSGRLLQ